MATLEELQATRATLATLPTSAALNTALALLDAEIAELLPTQSGPSPRNVISATEPE